mmetsp:Transcript_15535/g.52067  ORF Transcript_15535/g.52067 Transcript_15535/m.52067 type:complete len:137 (+) Transcript_15535:2450-2860(+)
MAVLNVLGALNSLVSSSCSSERFCSYRFSLKRRKFLFGASSLEAARPRHPVRSTEPCLPRRRTTSAACQLDTNEEGGHDAARRWARRDVPARRLKVEEGDREHEKRRSIGKGELFILYLSCMRSPLQFFGLVGSRR